MDRKEMIEKWKNNLAEWRETPSEMKKFAMEIGACQFEYLRSDGIWRGECKFCEVDRFRLRPDYTEPEDEVERCEVFISCGDFAYRRKNCANNSIHCALSDPDFIGYEYDGGRVVIHPRWFTDKMQPAEYPKYVLFRRGK